MQMKKRSQATQTLSIGCSKQTHKQTNPQTAAITIHCTA